MRCWREGNPAASRIDRSAAEALLLFFGVLRARFPRLGNFQQRLPVRSAHLARDTEAISRVLPEFFRLPQRGLLSPRNEATPVFGTLFSNNVVMRNCGEQMDPGPTFTAACRGGFGCRCFLPSTIVDMPRNASGWRSKSPTPKTKRVSSTWLKPFANWPTRTTPDNQVGQKAEQTFVWSSDVFFCVYGTRKSVPGFVCSAGQVLQ